MKILAFALFNNKMKSIYIKCVDSLPFYDTLNKKPRVAI